MAWFALLATWLLPRPLTAQAGSIVLSADPGYRWNTGDPNHPHAAAVGAELDIGITQLAAMRLTSTLYQAPGISTAEVPVVGAVTGGEAGVGAVVLVDLLDAWVPTISVHALAGYAPALAASSDDLLGAIYLGFGAGIGLDYRIWDPCCIGIGVRYTMLSRSTAIDPSSAMAGGMLDAFVRLSVRFAVF